MKKLLIIILGLTIAFNSAAFSFAGRIGNHQKFQGLDLPAMNLILKTSKIN